MEATAPAKKRKRRVTRLTVHIDAKLVTRMWKVRGETQQTLSFMVEEAILRLFDGEKPTT